MATEEEKEPYPWHLLARTVLIIVSFMSLGLCDTLRGPTILDLKDLLQTSVSEISFILMMGSIGSMVGCFAVGVLMDKLVRFRNVILAVLLVLLGTCSSLFPYTPNLPAIYTAAFFSGTGSGAFDSGGQVLLLEVWKGRDSGPYMHALHFMFAVGAFLAPIIARPFLSNVEETLDIHNQSEDSNSTQINSANDQYEIDMREYILAQTYNIRMLYPLVGAIPVLLSLGFIGYFLVDFRKTDLKEDNKEIKPKEHNKDLKGKKLIVLILMMVFFFLYVGLEVAFGTYLMTFGVKSKLGLSRAEGSDLTAVFWGAFATMRGIAIPLAVILPPEIVMIGSFVCCLGGSFLLSLFGETHIILLYICTCIMGLGTASIFATGILWLERRIKITNRIGAAMVISSSLGAKTFPVLVGQIVEELPMSLMYLALGISIGCTVLFIFCSLLARTLMPVIQDDAEESQELEAYPEART